METQTKLQGRKVVFIPICLSF